MPRSGRLDLGDVGALYAREVRSALRERTVLVNSVLLPVLLYPLLLWVQTSALVLIAGISEQTQSRIVLVDPPREHPALLDSMEADASIEILSAAADPEEALGRLRAGDADAVLEFDDVSAPAEATLPRNFSVTLHYDRSVNRSRTALDRAQGILRSYRSAWVLEEGYARGLDSTALTPFEVETENVSSDEALGASLLGTLIPLFLVVSVALGCLVPAVDATAGERERGTWETLMSTPPSLGSIVTAKYLYVASFGATAGILNVAAVALTLGPVLAPLQSLDAENPFFSIQGISFTTGAALVMVAGAAALALFFAAAMMLLASFARTFKDGQALVTPVFYLALLPLILGRQSDLTLTPVIAAIPIANVAMAIRDAIHGVFSWPLLVETAVASGLLIYGCLALSRWVLQFEDFLLSGHGGSLWRFLRQQLRDRTSAKTLQASPSVRGDA